MKKSGEELRGREDCVTERAGGGGWGWRGPVGSAPHVWTSTYERRSERYPPIDPMFDNTEHSLPQPLQTPEAPELKFKGHSKESDRWCQCNILASVYMWCKKDGFIAT